ncbi:hypothetical protein BDZ91DRAFT_738501 [Kalaharituber pfeilii]|nr:hypothetical protein BDZ91DRAFT_738501 [Kalaharituber pfeilii]
MNNQNNRYPWQQYKDEIQRLYIDEHYTLRQLQDHFNIVHPTFTPSTRAFKNHLKSWGFEKYNKNCQSRPKSRVRRVTASVHTSKSANNRTSDNGSLPQSLVTNSSSSPSSSTFLFSRPTEEAEGSELKPTLEQAEDALLLVESLNGVWKLAPHALEIILDGTERNVKKLAEDPSHSVWQRYLNENNSEHFVTEASIVQCQLPSFDGDWDKVKCRDNVSFLKMRRWLLAMHDRAEQLRDVSLQFGYERHSLTFNILLTARDNRIYVFNFPQVISVLSNAAQFHITSDRPLKLIDQFLEMVKNIISLKHLGRLPNFAYLLLDTNSWSRFQSYIKHIDPFALVHQRQLSQDMEQLITTIRRHFPGAFGSIYKASRESIARFLHDVRDILFPGFFGLFIHTFFMHWICLLSEVSTHDDNFDFNTYMVIEWFLLQRLFTLGDEVVKTMKTSSGHITRIEWNRFARSLHHWAEVTDYDLRFPMDGSENLGECGSCPGWCSAAKRSTVQNRNMKQMCEDIDSGDKLLPIEPSQRTPSSQHWCQCCVDEINPTQLCGRTFEPCCKGHMIGLTLIYDRL